MPLVEWSAGTGENGSEGTVSSEIGSEAFLVMKHEETSKRELGRKLLPSCERPAGATPTRSRGNYMDGRRRIDDF